MSGLSNIDLEKFVLHNDNEDLKANFKKVISSNSLTRYLDFKKIVSEGNTKYPFLIMNTARKNHKGVHWWSLLNIDPAKHIFLFDSEGFLGFKVFILNSDNKVIDKILFNIKKFNKSDTQIRCVEVTFSVSEYRKIKPNEFQKLSDVAQDLFHLLSEYAYIKGQEQELKLACLDNEVQSAESSTCGNYQLYFYKHLFDLLKCSKIISHTKLNKNTKHFLTKFLQQIHHRMKNVWLNFQEDLILTFNFFIFRFRLLQIQLMQ